MRSRVLNAQFVTVRPLKDQADQADAFGDAPLAAPGGGLPRDGSFRMKMQVEWGGATNFGTAVPGRQTSLSAEVLILKRHIPVSANGWEPDGGDIFELVSGRKMFVEGVELDFPRRVSKNHPDGGWDGWRVRISDRNPMQSAATSYD